MGLEWTDAILAECERLYCDERLSLAETARRLGTNPDSVKRSLSLVGIATRGHSEAVVLKSRQRTDLDISPFEEIKSQFGAYWLGFIAADGSVREGPRSARVTIELTARSAAVLDPFASHFGRKLRRRTRPGLNGNDKTYLMVIVDVNSRALVDTLIEKGVGPHKAEDPGLTLAWDATPESLRHHFVRGCFDGDGSAFEAGNSGHFVLELSGNRHLLEVIRAALVDELGVAAPALVGRRTRHKDAFATVRWGAPLDICKIRGWLYRDHDHCLEYKREIMARVPDRSSPSKASRFRGVSCLYGRWKAKAYPGGRNGKTVSLGTFDEELDAARAYDDYIFELKGAEAPQNLKGLEYIALPAIYATT